MILTFLNLLRLVSWPTVWSVLESVPGALEKAVCPAAAGWGVVCVRRSIWLRRVEITGFPSG